MGRKKADKEYSHLNHNILFIDHEEVMGEFLTKLFSRKTNCTTAFASSVTEALNYLGHNSVDLVISANIMPSIHVVDILKIITRNYTPNVILHAGYWTHETKREAFLNGAKAYIKPPFSGDVLVQLADRIINKNISYIGYRLN